MLLSPQVLVETARFVRRSGGGQVEVLLRVKQGSNPTFSFLFPGDRSHPYYRWIVDTNPKVSSYKTIDHGKTLPATLLWHSSCTIQQLLALSALDPSAALNTYRR
jgi:hypothetical protein